MKFPLIYTDVCLKSVFVNLTLSRNTHRRSSVSSERGTATDEPEMYLRHPPVSVIVQSPAVCNESHEVCRAVPRSAFTRIKRHK